MALSIPHDISVDKYQTQKHQGESENLWQRQLFPEQQGREGHNNNRAAVVQKGGKADTDLLVGFI